jgi:uncharacterized small protein (TIGR04563 family)
MPTYLQHFEIDWGWPRLSEAERTVVRRHEARKQADAAAVTLTTLKEALAAASSELQGREIRARAEDEGGQYAIVAREGRCSEAEEDRFDDEGKFPDGLTADDYRAAGVKKLCVGLFWPEGMLDAMKAQASRLDRSLSWVVEKSWIVAQGSAPPPAGGNALARDGDRRKQSIYLPIEIYAELADIAAREDRSMSFLVQRALTTAWPTIATLPPESR